MESKPTARQLIRAAVAAAGGQTNVGITQGIRPQAVGHWIRTGRVPTERIIPLCEAGANVVQPTQLLDAMTREAGEKVAA